MATAVALPAQPRRRFTRRKLQPYLYLVPALTVMAVITFYPLIFQVWMSFTNFGPKNFRVNNPIPPEFVGLDNYIRLLGDEKWLGALWFTTIYTIAVTAVTFLLGFALALLVRVRQRRFVMLRTAFYLPVVIGMAVSSFIFLYLFDQLWEV